MQRLDYAALRKSCRIPILTVCNSPKDFPGRFVIRLFDVEQPTMLYFAFAGKNARKRTDKEKLWTNW